MRILVKSCLAALGLVATIAAARAERVVNTPMRVYGSGDFYGAAGLPDGEFILISGNAGMFLYNARSYELARAMHVEHELEGKLFAFSANGKTALAVGIVRSYDVVKSWNLSDGSEIRTMPEILSVSFFVSSIKAAALSPDGTKAFTGHDDGTARLWSVVDETDVTTFSGHTDIVYAVAFSPDGTKVLTGSADQTAKIWNVADRTVIHSFAGHTGTVNSVAFSPDGTKILTGGEDNAARLWNVSDGVGIQTFPTSSPIRSVAFSPDGTEVLTGGGGVKIWNAADGSLIRTFPGGANVAFLLDGTRVLSVGGDPVNIEIWDAADGTKIHSFSDSEGHRNPLLAAAFSPDGSMVATASNDMTAKVWGTWSAEELRTFSGHTMDVYSVVFSPDGTRLLYRAS